MTWVVERTIRAGKLGRGDSKGDRTKSNQSCIPKGEALLIGTERVLRIGEDEARRLLDSKREKSLKKMREKHHEGDNCAVGGSRALEGKMGWCARFLTNID